MTAVEDNGQEWIRTTEGVSQQIYSLPRLAASVPTRLLFIFRRMSPVFELERYRSLEKRPSLNTSNVYKDLGIRCASSFCATKNQFNLLCFGLCTLCCL